DGDVTEDTEEDEEEDEDESLSTEEDLEEELEEEEEEEEEEHEDDDVDEGEVADEDTDGESSTASSESYDPQTVTVPVTLCLAIMVSYVCGGALLFAQWESWNLLDGSYFCFISLSTIGFGDIVPGGTVYSEKVEMSFIFCSMYLMLGMALIAMCFNLMQEEVIHKMRSCVRTLRYVTSCAAEPGRVHLSRPWSVGPG
ncbi:Potassium channel subfamily K member 18, partial [Frankliniella fusca]